MYWDGNISHISEGNDMQNSMINIILFISKKDIMCTCTI